MLWRWILGFLCLVLACETALAVFEFFIWNKVPPALAGKWEAREGGNAATFEYFRDGTLEVRVNNQKQSPSRVVVEGRTVFTTLFNANKLQEETRKTTIRQLTADSLIIELEDGNELKMVRAK